MGLKHGGWDIEYVQQNTERMRKADEQQSINNWTKTIDLNELKRCRSKCCTEKKTHVLS